MSEEQAVYGVKRGLWSPADVVERALGLAQAPPEARPETHYREFLALEDRLRMAETHYRERAAEYALKQRQVALLLASEEEQRATVEIAGQGPVDLALVDGRVSITRPLPMLTMTEQAEECGGRR